MEGSKGVHNYIYCAAFIFKKFTANVSASVIETSFQ